jgi:hypothetical protein
MHLMEQYHSCLEDIHTSCYPWHKTLDFPSVEGEVSVTDTYRVLTALELPKTIVVQPQL